MKPSTVWLLGMFIGTIFGAAVIGGFHLFTGRDFWTGALGAVIGLGVVAALGYPLYRRLD